MLLDVWRDGMYKGVLLGSCPVIEVVEDFRGGYGATEMLSLRRFVRGGEVVLEIKEAAEAVVEVESEREDGRRPCFVCFSLSWIFCRCRRRRSLFRLAQFVGEDSICRGHTFERISEHTRDIRMVSLSCGFVRVWLDVRVD